ncbi:PucR family transcriptional regulator [Williamsia sp. SKLECPSW1]
MTAPTPSASATARRERSIRLMHHRAYSVIDAFSAEVPAYDDVPSALVERDVVRGIRLNVDLYFHHLANSTTPTADEFGPLVDLAVRRHQDGVPLEDILEMYQSGSTLIWDQLAKEVLPQDGELLLEGASSLVRHLAIVTGRIAVACTPRADSQELWGKEEARRAVAVALLTGVTPERGALDRVGPLASAYVVLVVDPADSADPTVLRAIHTRTAAIQGSFTVADAAGWTALLPVADLDADEKRWVFADIFPDLSTRSAPGFFAGATDPVVVDAIPGAWTEAQTLCRAARLQGRWDEPCTADTVLFAYTVATARAAHPHLRHVIDTLAVDRTVQETLWVYLDSGCNQLATAELMHVHRNTVSYRLNRVAKLTGHDPQTPDGSWVLGAARLTAELFDR